MKDNPLEKVLRDIRIFPIFEGANDVMRAFIALTGVKPVGERLSGLGDIGLSDPIRSIGVLADYVGRIRSEVRPGLITQAHPELSRHADVVSDQVGQLRSITEGLLREHRKEIQYRQFHQKRLADAIADIYAQVAVLSRATSIFEDQGVQPSGQERYIAETFCERAAARPLELRPDRGERRRPHDRHREAGVQAWRVRVRAVRLGLPTSRRPWPSPTRRPSARRSPPRRSSRPRGRRGRAGGRRARSGGPRELVE